jgi:opacity protein-like surface antigen
MAAVKVSSGGSSMYVLTCNAGSTLKRLLLGTMALLSAGTIVGAADLPVKAPQPVPWSWTGFYLGAHTGGGLDVSHVADPYGPTLFGDRVRSPGPLLGAQFGYDWQNGPWVFGGQADVTWADMDGTFTCLQPGRSLDPLPPGEIPGFTGGAYGATCQVRPHWFGTVTGRVGRAMGPGGEMLIYAKGGLAWMQGRVDVAVNNIRAGTDGPENVLVSSRFAEPGWTAGVGVEYALGGNWSLMLEYDYLRFGRHDLATPDAPIMPGVLPGIDGSSAPDGRTTGVSQDIHAMKLGLNYRFGDRAAPLASRSVNFVPTAGVVNAFEVEVGTRYVHGWGRYQQDLAGGPALPVNNSRLTWDHLQTDGAELFARIDTTENVVLKGVIGGGAGNLGYINDEDWGLQQPFEGDAVSVFPYQNSISGASTNIRYLTVDAGYDWFRQPAYRFTPFIGYSYLEQHLQTPKTLDYIMYSPAAVSGTLGLGQDNNWHAVRVGAATDILLAPRLHLNAEAAYLPYVHYRGHDDHGPGAISPQWGDGHGVQLEAILSYDVTDRWSVGVGSRYWAFWIPNGETANFATGGTGGINQQTFAAEQAAAFLQVSYKFGVPWGGNH